MPEGVQPPVRDADNVMVCLKRALKIANSAQQQLAVVLKGDHTTPVMLFVEILNHYLFYFEQGNPSITTSVLQVRLLSAVVLANADRHAFCIAAATFNGFGVLRIRHCHSRPVAVYALIVVRQVDVCFQAPAGHRGL